MAARIYESALMAAVVLGPCAVGVALYLILATLVTSRLLLHAIEPESLSPTYWIYMGATATSVLAGAQILHLPSELPVMIVVALVACVPASVSMIAAGIGWPRHSKTST